jgi:hypothetical protein
MKPLPLLLLALGVAVLAPAARAALNSDDELAAARASGLDFFEKKIRPVLTEKCYKCHSANAEKVKGGLVLDTREGIRRGGDNGPAVVPGKLDDSLLIEAMRYENKDFAMPPQKSGGKLSSEVIKDFEKWVQMGAPDPRDSTAPAGGQAAAPKQDNWAKARDWWAWQDPQRTPAPTVKNAAWPKSDLDKYLLSAMETKGIEPVADADKLTLLRRVYFDLIGLPPTAQEINTFLTDTSPQAFTRVVDRLLASPQFGERWGRHWLDVARYAESSGKDANTAFPHAWRYRDYVISAFNHDKPFDEFVREQLAGDLLPSHDAEEQAEHIIATGFLAIGAKGLTEQNGRQYALDLADEQLDTVSQAFLGMTVACARCHDHKFDPIPQKEYYGLAGIFLSTETNYGTAFGVQNRHSSELIELPKAAHEPTLGKSLTPSERDLKEQRVEALKKELQQLAAERMAAGAGKGAPPAGQKQLRNLVVVTQLGFLNAELKNYNLDGSMKALAMGVRDLPATASSPGFGFFGGMGGGFGGMGSPGNRYQARMQQLTARPREFSFISDSAVYARGDVEKPGEKAPRGFLNLLTHSTPPSIPSGSSGRLQLAEWITAPSNPLTGRVMVNRVWHWLFGEGIVTSTDNFGTTGASPSNQALLDSLAIHFEQSGWSVKRLVREIVLSHAYQLSSTYNEADFSADPEDALVWRMSKRRLDAEEIRDAVLAASGQLQIAPPVGSLIAKAGDGPIGQVRYVGIAEATIVNSGTDTNVRSVYLPIARDLLPDALAVFDFSEPSLVSGNRESTNVPSQALYLLNSPFIDQAAKKLATYVTAAYPAGPNGALTANLDQRVQLAYWVTCSRGPSPVEKKAAYDFFNRFPGNWKPGDQSATATHDNSAIAAAWTSFCRALFASADFRYLN